MKHLKRLLEGVNGIMNAFECSDASRVSELESSHSVQTATMRKEGFRELQQDNLMVDSNLIDDEVSSDNSLKDLIVTNADGNPSDCEEVPNVSNLDDIIHSGDDYVDLIDDDLEESIPQPSEEGMEKCETCGTTMALKDLINHFHVHPPSTQEDGCKLGKRLKQILHETVLEIMPIFRGKDSEEFSEPNTVLPSDRSKSTEKTCDYTEIMEDSEEDENPKIFVRDLREIVRRPEFVDDSYYPKSKTDQAQPIFVPKKVDVGHAIKASDVAFDLDPKSSQKTACLKMPEISNCARETKELVSPLSDVNTIRNENNVVTASKSLQRVRLDEALKKATSGHSYSENVKLSDVGPVKDFPQGVTTHHLPPPRIPFPKANNLQVTETLRNTSSPCKTPTHGCGTTAKISKSLAKKSSNVKTVKRSYIIESDDEVIVKKGRSRSSNLESQDESLSQSQFNSGSITREVEEVVTDEDDDPVPLVVKLRQAAEDQGKLLAMPEPPPKKAKKSKKRKHSSSASVVSNEESLDGSSSDSKQSKRPKKPLTLGPPLARSNPGYSKEVATAAEAMHFEMKQERPAFSVLSKNMNSTYAYRQHMYARCDDIARVLHFFPAFRDYRCLKEEFERCKGTSVDSLRVKLADPMAIEYQQFALSQRPSSDPVISNARDVLRADPGNMGLLNDLQLLCLGFQKTHGKIFGHLYRQRSKRDPKFKGVTPTIDILDSVGSPSCRLTVYCERTRICDVPNFFDAVLCSYALYWIFNLQYESNAQPLFEFFDTFFS